MSKHNNGGTVKAGLENPKVYRLPTGLLNAVTRDKIVKL